MVAEDGPMTASSDYDRSHKQLRTAVVVSPAEDAYQVFGYHQLTLVRYSEPFKPRADRVTPGHLVAIAATPDGSEVIVWRWFDAVVLGEAAGQVRLWEPAHGEVLAQPRLSPLPHQPGSRAYLSAGLAGADWWVAGAAAVPAEDADVELEEVRRFYSDHGLWDGLT